MRPLLLRLDDTGAERSAIGRVAGGGVIVALAVDGIGIAAGIMDGCQRETKNRT